MLGLPFRLENKRSSVGLPNKESPAKFKAVLLFIGRSIYTLNVIIAVQC